VATTDPLRLALQKADVPTGATGNTDRKTDYALAPLGVSGLKGATYLWSWAAGGTTETSAGPFDNEWVMNGDVFVAPNETGARTLYKLGKRAGIGFFSDTGSPREYLKSGIPRLGDEQFAFVWKQAPVGYHGVVFVRKRAVVWEISIAPAPTKFHPTRARVLQVLKQFALKQRGRVGSA
jgi:hypothetical protein